MRDVLKRIRKLERRLKKCDNGGVIFQVRDDHAEEDYQKQYSEYIANGGDPNGLIIVIRVVSSREGNPADPPKR